MQEAARGWRLFSLGMGTFFTARQRRLMGLPEPKEPYVPPANLPPRCCEKATDTMCTCQARGWNCPDHGAKSNPCNSRFTHD